MAAPGVVTNMKEFMDGLRKCEGEFKRKFALRVRHVIALLHEEITSRTPVWSGSALANMQWSMSNVGAYVEPIDNGPKGHTNNMPLGMEPRRQPNLDLATASLDKLSFTDPYRVYWLNNEDPDIGGIERGLLPRFPLKSRSPNGMFALSIQYVAARLASGGI